MENYEFLLLAEKTIENIANAIEEADSDYTLDTDFIDGVLTIILPDGGEYVINKHDASAQIWVSSPISGARHFSYDNDEWQDNNNDNLFDVLREELEEFLEEELEF